MTALVWFRADLRTDDHMPLADAAASGRAVVPVVSIDVDLARRTQHGVGRLGAHRARFFLECVEGLRKDLRALGSDLVVVRGRPQDALPAVIERAGATVVHFHRGFAADEQAEERALARRFPQVDWRGRWGNVLVTPDLVPFLDAEVPPTFTAFRKRVEARLSSGGALAGVPAAAPAPDALPPLPAGIDPGSIPSLEDFGLTAPPRDPRATMEYRGGRQAGVERVRQYFWSKDRLRVYKETRNGLLAADDSSKLSPWLAAGALSPRWILDQVRGYERERVANESTYWLLFELLWRDYFQYVARQHGSALFHVTGLRGHRLPWRRDPALIEAWQRGRTGYPLVDASMRELAATGYTSNRARQNVASFFTKVLGQDWRIGAAWFERALIDYDPASNWGNWAYNAGVGNDARDFRYFHIPKQARQYDPDGAFVRHWLPELAALPTEWLAEPHLAPPSVQAEVGLGERYPLPVVDLSSAVRRQRRAHDRAARRAGG